MIVNDQPHIAGLRFWYYALPINVTGKARREAVAKLKAANLKSCKYGLSTKEQAEKAAKAIEASTGVELEIGRHDFL